MEILDIARYGEYEEFVRNHPQGGITQSVLWHGVKNNWGHEIVVSRDQSGCITGGASVLIQKVPLFGTTMLYSPRGPVCDLHNPDILADLKLGIDQLAKKHNAHLYKMDPDILRGDSRFPGIAKAMGFRNELGGDGFETIQARFNYRLYLEGRDKDQLFANLTQRTRSKIRKAWKFEVEVRVVDSDYLDDFMRLMETTGARDGFNVRPKSYFARMLHELGEHCRLYMAFYQGRPVSAAITTNYAGKTCYIYGASSNENREVMASHLLQWEMIGWAVETGCTVYDFQGVSGNLSPEHPLFGLYQFKKGFNGTLDELAGEFDLLYKPVTAKLVDKAIDINESLRKIKGKLVGR